MPISCLYKLKIQKTISKLKLKDIVILKKALKILVLKDTLRGLRNFWRCSHLEK